MAEGESESGEKTLDASEQRLKQARQDGMSPSPARAPWQAYTSVPYWRSC
jgi:hypothetical protein